jgi:hypothetical protein
MPTKVRILLLPPLPNHFHEAKRELAGDIEGVRQRLDAEATPGQGNRAKLPASGVEVVRRAGGRQSEGREIHFRTVRITRFQDRPKPGRPGMDLVRWEPLREWSKRHCFLFKSGLYLPMNHPC